MKAIRVQYTVQEGYVETNKKNIKTVMDDLRELKNPNIKYASFLLEDGRTFMHFALYPDEQSAAIVNNLPSFNTFRTQLKQSQPEVPPQAENLTLVASAWDFFD